MAGCAISRAAFTLRPVFLLLSFAQPLAASAAADPSARYTVVDLGTMGGTVVRAQDLNNRGQVVGFATIPEGLQPSRAFLYLAGHMRNLGSAGGWSCTVAAINDRQILVGDAAFRLSKGEPAAGSLRAVVHRGGIFVPLKTLATPEDSSATDINNRDQIVGYSGHRPVLWEEDTVTELPMPNGDMGFAQAINDHGLIAGHWSTRDGARSGMCLWRDGLYEDITPPDGGQAVPKGINNRGEIVGWWRQKDGGACAFLWRDGEMRGLDRGGVGEAAANAINEAGQVVGMVRPRSEGSGQRQREYAALWDDGRLLDLNNLIPKDTGWHLDEATGTNDAGLICGYGVRGIDRRAFLLVPDTTAARKTP